MACQYSRRDILKVGLSVAGALSAGAPRAWGQPYLYRGTLLRPRQRPTLSGRALPDELPEGLRKYLDAAEAAVAEPVQRDHHRWQSCARLLPDPEDRHLNAAPHGRCQGMPCLAWCPADEGPFPVDSDAWRRWSNIHVYLMRHGVSLEEMSPAQRHAALMLLRASLSQQGFETARVSMKLNRGALCSVHPARLAHRLWRG